jgi:hypothetical protein
MAIYHTYGDASICHVDESKPVKQQRFWRFFKAILRTHFGF